MFLIDSLFKRKSLFILPSLKELPSKYIYNGQEREWGEYSKYNYFTGGLISKVKMYHFEIALKITKGFFYDSSAIDFGCGDGIFLPSLSNYFQNVVGVDNLPSMISDSQELVKSLGLDNVELICNETQSFNQLFKRLEGREYKVIYLLETIEHVGEKKNFYPSKVEILINLSSLLHTDGIILLSMPKMVGLSYLFARIGMFLFGMVREKISLKNLFKAVVFCNTDDLEKYWTRNKHLGFNHKKLFKAIRNDFEILKVRDLGLQVMWVIRLKNKSRS